MFLLPWGESNIVPKLWRTGVWPLGQVGTFALIPLTNMLVFSSLTCRKRFSVRHRIRFDGVTENTRDYHLSLNQPVQYRKAPPYTVYLGCVTTRVTPDKPRPKVVQGENLANLRMIIEGNANTVLQWDGFSIDSFYAHVDDKRPQNRLGMVTENKILIFGVYRSNTTSGNFDSSGFEFIERDSKLRWISVLSISKLVLPM